MYCEAKYSLPSSSCALLGPAQYLCLLRLRKKSLEGPNAPEPIKHVATRHRQSTCQSSVRGRTDSSTLAWALPPQQLFPQDAQVLCDAWKAPGHAPWRLDAPTQTLISPPPIEPRYCVLGTRLAGWLAGGHIAVVVLYVNTWYTSNNGRDQHPKLQVRTVRTSNIERGSSANATPMPAEAQSPKSPPPRHPMAPGLRGLSGFPAGRA